MFFFCNKEPPSRVTDGDLFQTRDSVDQQQHLGERASGAGVGDEVEVRDRATSWDPRKTGGKLKIRRTFLKELRLRLVRVTP